MPFGLGLGILCLSLYDGPHAPTSSACSPGRSSPSRPISSACSSRSAPSCSSALLLMWRPLRFDSLDPDVGSGARRADDRGVARLHAAARAHRGRQRAHHRRAAGAWRCWSHRPPPPCASRRAPSRCRCCRAVFGFVSAVGGILLGDRRHAAGQPVHHDDLVRDLRGLPAHRRATRTRREGAECEHPLSRWIPHPPRPLPRSRVESPPWSSSATRGSASACAKRSPTLAGFVSAQSLHATLRGENTGIGLATVYRALAGLAAQGEADSLQSPEGESLYRACTTRGHHHHLICRSCGLTVEIEATDVEQWARRTARRARLHRGGARRRHLRALRNLRGGPRERA